MAAPLASGAVPGAAPGAVPGGVSAGAFRGPDAPSLDGIRTCVHCGICLPACPTYRVLGQEMDSPRGRVYLMRALAEGRLEPTEAVTRHFDLCLGCRACETACPAGVRFGSLLEATRAQLGRARPGRGARARLTRLLLAIVPRPERLGALLAAGRLYQRSGLQRLVRASGVLALVPRLAALDALLEAPAAAPVLPEVVPAVGRRRGRLGLLTGCVQRHAYPAVNAATARLLALAGWDVVAPRGQGCCGALELHAGRPDDFRARVRALARVFAGDVDLVVTNAAGCGAALKEAAHWAPGDADVASLARRTRDVSEVLADADLPLGPLSLTVTYHDACHLAHGQRLRREPRALLARVPGLSLVEMAESDLCCGSAGIYNVQEPALADRLLELKLDRIAATGAQAVVAGNPGCLLQIARGARRRGLALEVLHPVELLARAVAAGAGSPAR
jgi:glycolate oxidase iron-sulfur subunit